MLIKCILDIIKKCCLFVALRPAGVFFAHFGTYHGSYCVTPAVTRGLVFCSLVWRSAINACSDSHGVVMTYSNSGHHRHENIRTYIEFTVYNYITCFYSSDFFSFKYLEHSQLLHRLVVLVSHGLYICGSKLVIYKCKHIFWLQINLCAAFIYCCTFVYWWVRLI